MSKLTDKIICTLREVQSRIKAEPLQFDMQSWYRERDRFNSDSGLCDITIPNCGTAACIAGWMVCIDRNINPSQAVMLVGDAGISVRQAFRVEDGSALDWDKLFYDHNWPQPYRQQFYEAENIFENDARYAAMAKVACERIDHFIRTDGAE